MLSGVKIRCCYDEEDMEGNRGTREDSIELELEREDSSVAYIELPCCKQVSFNMDDLKRAIRQLEEPR